MRACRGLGGWRVFRVLRQAVGDPEPRRLAGDKDVAFRADARIVIQNAERYAQLGSNSRIRRGGFVGGTGPVDHRRTANAAETAAKTAGGFVVADQILALDPFEIRGLDANAATERGAVLLAAAGAMAIQRPQQRTVDFELDAAAKAASADRRHRNTSLCTPGHKGVKSHYDPVPAELDR